MIGHFQSQPLQIEFTLDVLDYFIGGAQPRVGVANTEEYVAWSFAAVAFFEFCFP